MGRVRNNNQEVHRNGPLKQTNKKHKTGRHRSKGVIDVETRGRVSSVGSISKKHKQAAGKLERRKQAAAIRDKKMYDVLDQKRKLGGRGASILVSLIPLSGCSNPKLTLKHLLETMKNDVVVLGQSGDTVHVRMANGKNVSLCVPATKDVWALLDIMKLSDVSLFHLPILEPLCAEGMTLLKLAREQGLTTPFIGVTSPYSKADEKMFLKSISKLFVPVTKVFPLQNRNQLLNAFRMITVAKQLIPKHWSMRSGMLIERSNSYVLTQDSARNILPTVPFDKTLSVLQVVGTVRRQHLNPQRPVHIAGVGDFRILRIDVSATTPEGKEADEEMCMSLHPFDVPPRYLYDPTKEVVEEAEMETEEDGDDSQIDSDEAESMISDTDAMDLAIESIFGSHPPKGASTSLQVSYDVQDGPRGSKKNKQTDETSEKNQKKLPKGTSSYQADWLPESDSEAGSLIGSDDELEVDDDDSQTEGNMDEDELDWEEDQKQLRIAKEARTEAEFPDWVDTPMDTPAKVRFQRYRGLQSFKKSPWDPYENLPREYAKIFQFANFRHTYKKVTSEEQDGPGYIPVGQRVTVLLTPINDPASGSIVNIMSAVNTSAPLALFSQLKHEGKMSVLNLHLNVSDVIKNKEELIFQVGCRRFQAKPILSEVSTGNKHKMLRFAQSNTSCVATVIAPVVFPTATVVAFRRSKMELIPVGSGHVLSIDPTRVAVKRVLLSGYPFRSHGRKAVVRFMFFNREDTEWFKPVELKTRYGLRGHIREPLGTHGRMKCIFDGPIKSQDTVLLPLYKRVFPKLNYDPNVPPFNVYDSYEIKPSILSAI